MKYSEEVIKQAEELIQKHSLINEGIETPLSNTTFVKAVKAAIVSCEFAIPYTAAFSALNERGTLEQIKSYLEEIL